MKRRKFIRNTGVAIATISLVQNTNATVRPGLDVVVGKIIPKGLEKGDKIGVITPGSGLVTGQFEKIVENLKKLGLTPQYGKFLRSRNGFLAGTDKQRLQDLHDMFRDESVKAIICGRGGYGSARLLDDIDYELIKNNPKILVGFSDITALICAIYKKTGLVAFHGPVGSSEFTQYTTGNFQSILMNNSSIKEFGTNPNAYTITPGNVNGELIGGNLTILVSLLGTPYEPDFKDKILFLEEVGEKTYRIDRMLTQLLLAGKLQQTKGIVMGNWVNCNSSNGTTGSYTLKQVLTERLGKLGIPTAYGFKIGHTDDNSTIPYGVRAEFNASERKLRLIEKPVM